jgi:Amt family ammonium transporter
MCRKLTTRGDIPEFVGGMSYDVPRQGGKNVNEGINGADTAWVLVSTALVMLMTVPGLALFYGGLVRRKNLVSTLMHSVFLLCLVTVQWVVLGYTLAFGADHGGAVGGLEHALFADVGPDAAPGLTVPHVAFALYQGMFAAITVALISGAYAERMKFGAFAAFSLLWTTVVYDPLAHWVWGGGWLMKLGALDFAGGTVVHVSSGVAALVVALVLGKRTTGIKSTPHNVGLTVLGAGLLWFGWFGFNAGSALAANKLAAVAFAATHVAAAAGGLAWAGIERALRGKSSVLGAVTGAVAGLVAITPASGYVTVGAALAIGAGAALVCYFGVNVLKERFGYDDTLDVFGVHGIGGTFGALATGVFATTRVNATGADGLLAGHPELLGKQAAGVFAAAALSGIATFAILKLVALAGGLRVSDVEESIGLDASIHGEAAYALSDGEPAVPGHGVPPHEPAGAERGRPLQLT